MCEEKHISTKVCSCCGNELPITAFNKHGRSKDGYGSVCRACKAKTGDGNPELARFTPRELIDELRCRGYHGTLEYVQRHYINV